MDEQVREATKTPTTTATVTDSEERCWTQQCCSAAGLAEIGKMEGQMNETKKKKIDCKISTARDNI